MSGGSVIESHQLFQVEDGGAIPTSPHQLHFKEINHTTISNFVIKHHYKHKAGASGWSFGAFFDGQLVGVCGFGKLASHTATRGVAGAERADCVWELNRLVLLDEIPKNSESRFIGWCLRQLPKGTIVVSYADTAKNHTGVVYKATNWIYTGLTKARTDIDVGDKHSRHYDKKSVDYSKRKDRSAKHRFVYFTDPKDKQYLLWSQKVLNTVLSL